MSVSEILREIQALPAEERVSLVEKLVQLSEADIPPAFREGMAEAARGDFIELEDVLKEFDRP